MELRAYHQCQEKGTLILLFSQTGSGKPSCAFSIPPTRNTLPSCSWQALSPYNSQQIGIRVSLENGVSFLRASTKGSIDACLHVVLLWAYRSDCYFHLVLL